MVGFSSLISSAIPGTRGGILPSLIALTGFGPRKHLSSLQVMASSSTAPSRDDHHERVRSDGHRQLPVAMAANRLPSSHVPAIPEHLHSALALSLPPLAAHTFWTRNRRHDLGRVGRLPTTHDPARTANAGEAEIGLRRPRPLTAWGWRGYPHGQTWRSEGTQRARRSTSGTRSSPDPGERQERRATGGQRRPPHRVHNRSSSAWFILNRSGTTTAHKTRPTRSNMRSIVRKLAGHSTVQSPTHRSRPQSQFRRAAPAFHRSCG